MVVISHFKLYPALFPLKWLICIPNISAVRGNVVFETIHDFYRTAIIEISEQLGAGKNAMHCNKKRTALRWASQCSALANSMAWTFYLIGETYSKEDTSI